MINLWDVILILVAIAICICQIVLFFKIWGMCDNVAILTRKLTMDDKEEVDADKEEIVADKEEMKPSENKKGDVLSNVILGILVAAIIALLIWGNW